MNITFLLGNGFDVGLGMKSKFSEYFPIYKEQSKNKPANIKQLSEKIQADKETWAYFEWQKGQYTSEFNLNTCQDYIDQFKDFEKSFIDYLKDEERLLDFDNNQTEISKLFIDGLQGFYKQKKLQSASSKVLNQKFEANKNSSHKYHFVIFNYTSTLERCIESIPNKTIVKRRIGSMEYTDSIGDIVHVHGRFEDGPIIGVDNISQIANTELAQNKRFQKYVVKPMTNQMHRNLFDSQSLEIIQKSDVICVYGMSLGATDKKWWVHILKWLNSNAAHQFVVFDYDEKYNPETPYDFFQKEDFYIDLLSEYAEGTNIDVESLRDRIHIAIHKNIFAINLRKKNKWDYLKEDAEEIAIAK